LAFLVAAGLGTVGAPPAAAQPADPPPALDQPRALVLEDIALTGATRTSLATVLLYLPLEPGQTIDQTGLVVAVNELRASHLFKTVNFFTRPGTRRGHLVLVLEVEEPGADFRWAAGNTDLDGWYLVPAMVAWDNLTGRGDILDLQWRLGFRHSGFLLNYKRPRSRGGRDYWGARLSAISTDRPWFEDGVEYRHEVETVGATGVYGHRLRNDLLGELALAVEMVSVADHSRSWTAAADGSIVEDQKIPADQLPAGIADAVGEDGRVVLQWDLQRDTRSRELRAGGPAAGTWGRLKTTGTLQGKHSHLGLQADLRSYRSVPGGLLAARLRGAVVGDNAVFYDRLYLGGMYSVRGFPSHSLSAPDGDTWLWSGSLEHRSAILGDKARPRLAGVLFVDAGASGTFDGDAFGGVSVGAGYGVRVRVWWLDWLGLDVGFPLTSRPLDERFQVTATIGWSF
jgi:outer membrane protein assembly factor BamA